MPAKENKPYKHLEIEVSDKSVDVEVIDITANEEEVFKVLLAQLKKQLGDKFGETQANEFLDTQAKDIKSLLQADFQSGIVKFYTVDFDNGSSAVPRYSIKKLRKLKKKK